MALFQDYVGRANFSGGILFFATVLPLEFTYAKLPNLTISI